MQLLDIVKAHVSHVYTSTENRGRHPVHAVFLGVAGLCLALFLTFPYIARLVRGRLNWSQRNRYELLLSAALLIACGLVGSMAIVFPIVQYAVEHSWQDIVTEFAARHLLSMANAWTWLPILAVIALFLIVGKASERATKWSDKLPGTRLPHCQSAHA